jgi:hypothetical protein
VLLFVFAALQTQKDRSFACVQKDVKSDDRTEMHDAA